MELLIPLAIVLSAFLAMNIGANNSAAAMATAYGAGVRTKREAVILIAIFAVFGALLAGGPVVETIGKGIVPGDVLTSNITLVIIVLVIAVFFITWANYAKVPIATTHAIVCAIAGVGLFARSLNAEKFFEIIIWWVCAPFVMWTINYLLGRFLYFRTLMFLSKRYSEKSINGILTVMLTISGCFLAFSAGANNSANSVGPLVGMGLLTTNTGAILAGVGMAVGALLFGGRVIETVGKQITEICILRAISVEFTGAALLITASLLGIPISMAEIITSGIIGFSCAQHGFAITAQNRHVVKIAFFWFVVPFVAVGVSYGLSSLYFKYGTIAMLNF